MGYRMNEHTLELLQGPRPPWDMHDVCAHDATELATILNGIIPAGRVVYKDTAGKWKLGIADGKVPHFLANNSNDTDVKFEATDPSTDANAHVNAAGAGAMKGVCSLQAHELRSTEFLQNLSYNIGDHLTAAVSDGVAANMLSTAGMLTNASVKPYSHNICGIVTQPYTSGVTAGNAQGYKYLQFYCWHLPKITGIAEPTWV